MWYSFEGYDKKNQPIIKEVPSGCESRVGDGKHFYYSDDREELYNHWVNNLNNQDEYEKLTSEYSTLIKGIKDKKIKNELYYNYPPFFQYHIALCDAKQITLEELSDRIAQHMDKIVKHFRVGMVMSEWSPDAHWNFIVTKFKYNRKTRIFTVGMLSFFKQFGNVGEENEETFDLKTRKGISELARFMGYDRGYWQDLNKLIEAYQEKVDKQIKFINSVKKLL
jgi:hypothetical protein